jgi:hypothetical protein
MNKKQLQAGLINEISTFAGTKGFEASLREVKGKEKNAGKVWSVTTMKHAGADLKFELWLLVSPEPEPLKAKAKVDTALPAGTEWVLIGDDVLEPEGADLTKVTKVYIGEAWVDWKLPTKKKPAAPAAEKTKAKPAAPK